MIQANNGHKYVNVNLMTMPGIQRAARLKVSMSGLAEIMITPHLHTVLSTLFSDTHHGRMIAVIRHPVERAIAIYQMKTLDPNHPEYHPEVAQMTLIEYAQSNWMDSNLMTRFLTEEGVGSQDLLSPAHERAAKRVLSTKCLVGLYDEMEKTVERVAQYLRPEKIELVQHEVQCIKNVLAREKSLRDDIPVFLEGDPEWEAIVERNHFDLKLYNYARTLWEEQADIFLEAQ